MSEHGFLENVRQALSDVLPERNKNVLIPDRPGDLNERLDAYKNKPRSRRLELLEELKENAAPINLDMVTVNTLEEARESILNLIQEKSPEYGTQKKVAAWRHPLIDELGLDTALDKIGIPFIQPPDTDAAPSDKDRAGLRQEIIESFVGITSADYCIAQTGTLTMKTRAKEPRSISLVPVIHIGIIRLDQIVEDLSELYFRLQWDPKEQEEGLETCMTFISGPSKTGDIELVMVHGAHGPRELHLYVITGE